MLIKFIDLLDSPRAPSLSFSIHLHSSDHKPSICPDILAIDPMPCLARQERDKGCDIFWLTEASGWALFRDRVNDMLALPFAEERCVDGAWGYGVDCDSPAPQVFGQDTGDLLNGALSGQVAKCVWLDRCHKGCVRRDRAERGADLLDAAVRLEEKNIIRPPAEHEWCERCAGILTMRDSQDGSTLAAAFAMNNGTFTFVSKWLSKNASFSSLSVLLPMIPALSTRISMRPKVLSASSRRS